MKNIRRKEYLKFINEYHRLFKNKIKTDRSSNENNTAYVLGIKYLNLSKVYTEITGEKLPGFLSQKNIKRELSKIEVLLGLNHYLKTLSEEERVEIIHEVSISNNLVNVLDKPINGKEFNLKR